MVLVDPTYLHHLEIQNNTFHHDAYRMHMERDEQAQLVQTARWYGYDDDVFAILTDVQLTISQQNQKLRALCEIYEHDFVKRYDYVVQNHLERQEQERKRKELWKNTVLQSLCIHVHEKRKRKERERQEQEERERKEQEERERRDNEERKRLEEEVEAKRKELEQLEKERRNREARKRRKREKEDEKRRAQKRKARKAKMRKKKQQAKQQKAEEKAKAKAKQQQAKQQKAEEKAKAKAKQQKVEKEEKEEEDMSSAELLDMQQDFICNFILPACLPYLRYDIIMTGPAYPRTTFEEYVANTSDNKKQIAAVAKMMWATNHDYGALFFTAYEAMNNHNYRNTIGIIRQCAENGHGLAAYYFGDFLFRGSLKKTMLDNAISFFKKAAHAKCPMGLLGLAKASFERGHVDHAMECLDLLIAYDHDMSRGPGYFLIAKRHRFTDPVAHLQYLEKSCSYGYPEAALLLGQYYSDVDNDLEIPCDEERAVTYFKQGLKYASPEETGLLYGHIAEVYGRLAKMTDNDANARATFHYYMKKAAAYDQSDACFYMYSKYMHDKKYDKGIAMLRKGVAHNHVDSMYRFALYSLDGQYGVEKDEVLAAKIFECLYTDVRKISEAGLQLGILKLIGRGIEKDESGAAMIFEELYTLQRTPEAAYRLGMMKLTGQGGVEKDFMHACMLLTHAKLNGVKEADRVLKNLMVRTNM